MNIKLCGASLFLVLGSNSSNVACKWWCNDITCVSGWSRSEMNILTPYWLKILRDDTASKMHLTQVAYVTRTSGRQQNLIYA